MEFAFHLQVNVVSNDPNRGQERYAYRDVCNGSLVSIDQPHMIVAAVRNYAEVQKKQNLKCIQVPAFLHSAKHC